MHQPHAKYNKEEPGHESEEDFESNPTAESIHNHKDEAQTDVLGEFVSRNEGGPRSRYEFSSVSAT